MREYQIRTSFRPRPLPLGRWSVTQRWNDLLFAHWPISAASISPLLPEGLEADTFQGSAWLGIVPFWLERLKARGIPAIPGVRRFPDLNFRTYVRDQATGTPGVYCFSIDASSLIAVTMARIIYQLPYYWAEMHMEQRSEREFAFYSRRRFAGGKVIFNARYRGLGPSERTLAPCVGSFEYFMTERSCLFSMNQRGQATRANLHYISWPLEEAEAEIERNDLAETIGINLPDSKPILHYSRRLALYVWPAELLKPALAPRPVTIAVSPSG
ncbi:MAG: DUF2071 domain-containing protein [Terracidiphilus sp.]|nr:DUF2071 domain-containing protein [Terracidiphilus sp.]